MRLQCLCWVAVTVMLVLTPAGRSQAFADDDLSPAEVAERVEQLRATQATKRAAAAWELARGGEVDTATVEALWGALADPSKEVGDGATWALWHVRNPDFDRTTLVEVPAKALKSSRPQYPQMAFVTKLEGTVVVAALIDTRGKVIRTAVVQSVPGLDQAAVDCLSGWLFKPAMRAGRAVPSVLEIPVGFRIF